MPKAMRIHRTGGPEVFDADESRWPRPGRARRASGDGVRGQFPRHLYPQRPISAAPAAACILGGRARAWSDLGAGVSGLKPGDRVVYSGQLGAYCEERLVAPTALPHPRRHERDRGGGDLQQGHDRRVPDPPRLSGEGGRDDPGPCRGGRGRARAVPMGEVSGRDRDRHGRHRGEGGARARQRLRSRHLLQREDFAARARADRRRGRRRSVFDLVGKDTFLRSMDACGRGAISSASARRRARRRRSIRAC